MVGDPSGRGRAPLDGAAGADPQAESGRLAARGRVLPAAACAPRPASLASRPGCAHPARLPRRYAIPAATPRQSVSAQSPALRGCPPPRGGADRGSWHRPTPAPRRFPASRLHPLPPPPQPSSLRRGHARSPRGETEAGRRVKWATMLVGKGREGPACWSGSCPHRRPRTPRNGVSFSTHLPIHVPSHVVPSVQPASCLLSSCPPPLPPSSLSSIHYPTYSSIHLFVYSSILPPILNYVFVHSSIHLVTRYSVFPPIYPSSLPSSQFISYLSVLPSTHLSTLPFLHPSTHLWVSHSPMPSFHI